MSDEWEVRQGSRLSIRVPLVDGEGTAIDSDYPGGGFTGTESLSGMVWPGGVAPVSFEFDPAWANSDDGEIEFTVTDEQTALLVPGRHMLAVWIDDGGEIDVAYSATLVVKPMPGGAS